MRYSGSPLAYSFSEANHRKGSWLVDLDANGLAAASFVDAPVPRPLATVRGTLEQLLTERRYETAEASWVQATLTDVHRPREAMDRLRTRFPHCLLIAFDPEGASPTESGPIRDRVVGRADTEILAHFFTDVRGSAPEADEEALLQTACEACRVAEDAAS